MGADGFVTQTGPDGVSQTPAGLQCASASLQPKAAQPLPSGGGGRGLSRRASAHVSGSVPASQRLSLLLYAQEVVGTLSLPLQSANPKPCCKRGRGTGGVCVVVVVVVKSSAQAKAWGFGDSRKNIIGAMPYMSAT